MQALERGANLGLPVTVTAVMMRLNYDKLPALARVAASLAPTARQRLPAFEDRSFQRELWQFWQGFTQLLESTRLVATTGPVLAAVLGLEDFAGPG